MTRNWIGRVSTPWLAVLALGIAAAGQPARVAAAQPSSVTGGGYRADPVGKATFSFNAIKKQDGSVTGQFEQQDHRGGLAIHATINCLNIINGNQAVLGGTITHVQKNTDPAFAFIVEGGAFLLFVQDNGTGGRPSPDTITPYFTGEGTPDCSVFSPADIGFFLSEFGLPVEGGDIQVRP